ncbi:MAG TPA: FHA domain-containing protein [Gemmataceae bacterium]|nr:FHA domain-containing protein [Gemmataceae bacterium]
MSRPEFPVLEDCKTGQRYIIGSITRFLVGRSEEAHLPVASLRCSRKHFQVVCERGHFFVESLVRENPTYLDGRVVDERAQLSQGATLVAGENEFRFYLHPTSPTAAEVQVSAPAPADDGFRTLPASAQQFTEVMALRGSFRISGSMLIGRDQSADIALVHPQVSRRHAVIFSHNNGQVVLRDLGSANGTFVNGRRLTAKRVLLNRDDRINIGPFALIFDGTSLVSEDRVNNIELISEDVSKIVTDRQTRKKLTLLDGITLVFKPREFVCLLGPSGSGKSTLMTIISGRAAPDRGAVLVNGQDLHANFDALKKDLALVPQKDVLHDSLTVGQALRYTARLRLPSDTGADETAACIQETLNTVALTHRYGTVIRQLSGGQIKRACLANEILCKPNLLFLDEVTSGLDERTDSDMMDLFRQIAHDGKTVVCITHSLTNVERTCDLVVILAPGGKLAFFGSPTEAKAYFGIKRLGEVYDRLEDKDVQPQVDWQQRYLDSPYYAKYVTDRLPRGRRGPPRQSTPARQRFSQRARLFLRQATVLTQRYLAIWRSNVPALFAMVSQSLIVALLLIIVFGNLGHFDPVKEDGKVPKAVNLLFLLAISSFWFGCNIAAKEVVKERTIFTRERDFNLLAGSYYLSKLVVLFGFGLLQVSILFGLTRLVCAPPGDPFKQFVILMALTMAGTTLGLLISTVSSSEEMAITLIPIAIIPQIILSGTIAPLSGLGEWLAKLGVTTYWGKRGLDAVLPSDVAAAAHSRSIAVDGSAELALALLGFHSICFILATLFIMALSGRSTTLKLQKIRRVVIQN